MLLLRDRVIKRREYCRRLSALVKGAMEELSWIPIAAIIRRVCAACTVIRHIDLLRTLNFSYYFTRVFIQDIRGRRCWTKTTEGFRAKNAI